MTTLVLGHERIYPKTWIHHSPIDVNLWYDKPFKCVDFMCDKKDTDIMYDLYNSIDYSFDRKVKHPGIWNWTFAEDNSYDTIIDCIGPAYWDKNTDQYRQQPALLKTILRVLKPNGIFYGMKYSYTKINNELHKSPYKIETI